MGEHIVIGPDYRQQYIDEQIQVYRQAYGDSGVGWVVDERDLVVIQTKQGPKPTGYNHSRAWRGAMNRYSPYTNPGDVEFCSQAYLDDIYRIINRVEE